MTQRSMSVTQGLNPIPARGGGGWQIPPPLLLFYL